MENILELKKQKAEVELRIGEIYSAIGDKIKEHSEKNGMLNEKIAERDKIEREIINKKDEVEKIWHDYDCGVAIIKPLLDEMRKTVISASDRVTELRGMKETSNEIRVIDAQISEMNKFIKEINTGKADLIKSKITAPRDAVKRRVEKLEKEISELYERKNGLERECAEIRDSNRVIQDEIDSMKKTQQDELKRQKELKARIAKVREDVAEIMRRNDIPETQIKNFEMRVATQSYAKLDVYFGEPPMGPHAKDHGHMRIVLDTNEVKYIRRVGE